jgi:hypothetical protein
LAREPAYEEMPKKVNNVMKKTEAAMTMVKSIANTPTL